MSILDLPLTELSDRIKTRIVSPRELTEVALERVAEADPEINAFVTVTADTARQQAAEAETAIVRGDYRGPLHGIPFAAKDLYETAGILTTASSQVRQNYVPRQNAAVIDRLRKAGMILIGKTETHEFAYGALTLQSGNPWDTTRTAGGSSGGSAAAVAVGCVHVALGTDTGGSIRVPAALCGTVGLKPTFGRVSRYGIVSLSWSLDHAGPLTRNVIDSAHLLDAITGYDSRDPASVDLSSRPSALDTANSARARVTNLRVGVPSNFFTERVNDAVTEAFDQSIERLSSLGARLITVSIPDAQPTDRMGVLHRTIFVPEMSAYHMAEMRASPDLFTDEVRTANEIGEAIFAVDYINAQRWRSKLRGSWRQLFRDIDVLITPTTPDTAISRADPQLRWPDGTIEGGEGYLRFTNPINLIGLPALQIPNGFTTMGLPIGMQIIGRPFDETTLFNVGLALEETTPHIGHTHFVQDDSN